MCSDKTMNQEPALSSAEFEDYIIQDGRRLFDDESNLRMFASDVRRFLFGAITDEEKGGSAPKFEVAREFGLQRQRTASSGAVALWNPFKRISKKAKCAACILGFAVLAAAIVGFTVAALGSGQGYVVVVEGLILEFAIPEAVAWAAVSGASAGVIASMLCPSCH